LHILLDRQRLTENLTFDGGGPLEPDVVAADGAFEGAVDGNL